MRIARIIEYFPPHIGGMERHGLILSQEQMKLGHQVDIFIGYGGNPRSDLKEFPRSDLGIYKMPLQFLPIYSKIRRLWFNFWAMRQIIKRHKKNPYDIIHLHGDFIEACFGGKLSKKLGIPSIITIHAGLNKRLLKPKNAICFKNITKIICVSNEIANDLNSIGVPENKIVIISSGIYFIEFQNIDEGKIAALQNQYSKPIIISVGVLRPAKGFKYLLEAFGKIKEKFFRATLVIIGEGPDRAKLEKQTKNITNINFLGRQDHSKIVEYLKVADIFVLSSIYMEGDREGTPTSIMEAMAAGLPVIATNVGGNQQLIKDGENGFLIESENSEALAKAIEKIIRDSNLAKKMGEKNLEDIKQKDWPVITEKINEIYKSVLHIS